MVERSNLKDQMKKAFPKRLENDIECLFNELEFETDHFHSHVEEYYLNEETVSVPYRIYIFRKSGNRVT